MWGGRGGLLEAESERWSAPELYDVWVPGCEARAALSTWDFKTKGQIWAPQQRDSDGWRVAVTWACSQRGEVKKMIDHHAMGESGEGLQEELSDRWSKMEPSVKVKQSHHSIPPVPWFQDHLLTWAKVWYSLILKFPNSRLLHFCTSVFSTTKHSRRPIFKDSKKHSQLSDVEICQREICTVCFLASCRLSPALFPQLLPLRSRQLISFPKLTSHLYETLIGLIREVIRNAHIKKKKK